MKVFRVEKLMKVYFNTDAIQTNWHDIFNLKEVIFAETPKMSTYLLAFVITNYPYRKSERKTENGVTLRTFNMKDDNNSTDILDLSSNVIDAFSGMILI